MSDWRYRARRASTGEWLDHNLMFKDPTLSWVLSGPNFAKATVPFGTPLQTPPDGRPMFGKMDTLLYAEYKGRMKWFGVCSATQPAADGLSLEFVGTTGWFAKLPYLGEFSGWFVPIWMVIRELMTATIPGHPNGRVTHGIDFQADYDDFVAYFLGDKEPPPRPELAPRGGVSDEQWNAYTELVKSQQAAWDKDYGKNQKFMMNWWESPTVGGEIDNLARAYNFEYRETIEGQWEANPYPKVSFTSRFLRRRTDIQFTDGVNMATAPTPKQDTTQYANGIIALGAGEGRDMKRAEYSEDDGRLSQTLITQYKALSNDLVLQGLVQADFRTANDQNPKIETVTIWDTPGFAPVASLVVGDEVLTRSRHTTPPISQWSRIISITKNTTKNVTVINLEVAA